MKKKKYIKPQIIIENFSLMTNIAGDCEEIVGNPARGTCAVISSGGINVFSGNINGCVFRPEDFGGGNDQWDGFCYHVPIEIQNLFNS